MDTATTTSTQKSDLDKEAQLAEQKKSRRIMRKLFPQVDENSTLLPTDKWALKEMWNFARTNKSFHKTASGMAGGTLGAVATVVAGVIGVFAVTGLAAVATVAVGALAVTGLLGAVAHGFFKKFKSETVPQLQKELGKKFLFDLKGGEIKAAWQKKKDEYEKKKAADKAAKVAAPVTAPVVVEAAPVITTPVVSAPVVETKKVEAPVAAEKKPEQTLTNTVGSWLLKKALEQAAKPKKDKTADTPASAAPANDAAPKIDAKKTAPPPKAA